MLSNAIALQLFTDFRMKPAWARHYGLMNVSSTERNERFSPPPKVKTLEEAQLLINEMWQVYHTLTNELEKLQS